MRATKAPPRGPINNDVQVGSALFDAIGCAACHVRNITTAPPGTAINGGAFGAENSNPGGIALFAVGSGFGVQGHSSAGTGVAGYSTNNVGLRGEGGLTGVTGISNDGNAINGLSSTGNSAYFQGKVQIVANGANPGNLSVAGTLSKGAGSFKIDHPLDPENKYLYHSFVESPDMKNICDGNVITNDNCEAVVEMPEYFEALNSDFRYQLTVLGTFAQAIVAEKIKGNRFVIKTNAPNVEVSWQVTGIRQDAFAKKNRIKVEVEKDERERGFYLHPEAFGLSEEKSVERVRHPEMMKQLQSQSEQVKQKQPNQPNHPDQPNQQ